MHFAAASSRSRRRKMSDRRPLRDDERLFGTFSRETPPVGLDTRYPAVMRPIAFDRRSGSQITFLENRCVMEHVPGNDVRQSAHGERMAVDHAVPHPGLRRQLVKERQRRGADRSKLVDVTGPWSRVGVRTRRSDVLVEAWQRGVESAREPERPKDEYALGIVDVTDDLADAPLVGGVAMMRLFL